MSAVTPELSTPPNTNAVSVQSATTASLTFLSGAATTQTGTMYNVLGLAGVAVYVTGIIGDTITPQTNYDGTQNNLVAVPAININTGVIANTITANGVYLIPVTGLAYLQLSLTRVGGTVTAHGYGHVSPSDIVAVDVQNAAINVPENVAQWGGNNVVAGNGNTGTGSPRVTVAADNTPFPIKLDQTTPGTTNAVALAQVGATTILTGNGATGAGSQRVTIASDNSPVPAKIDQTTPGTTNAVAISTLGATAVSTGSGVSDAGTQRTTLSYPTSYDSGGVYVASGVVKASAGTLYNLSGYNSKASAQFILLFDAAAVPADATAAKVVISVPAASNWSYSSGPRGRRFTAGICWSNSSTAPAKTLGAADCFVEGSFD